MVTIFAIRKYIYLYWGNVHPRALASCPLDQKSKCCLLALINALWDSVVEFHTAILSILGCGRCGDLHYSVLCYTLKQTQQCAD